MQARPRFTPEDAAEVKHRRADRGSDVGHALLAQVGAVQMLACTLREPMVRQRRLRQVTCAKGALERVGQRCQHGLLDIQRIWRASRVQMVEDVALREEGRCRGRHGRDGEEVIVVVRASPIQRRHHLSQHRWRDGEPVRAIAIRADRPAPIRVPLVVQLDNSKYATKSVTNACCSIQQALRGKTKRVLARRAAVFELAIADRAPKSPAETNGVSNTMRSGPDGAARFDMVGRIPGSRQNRDSRSRGLPFVPPLLAAFVPENVGDRCRRVRAGADSCRQVRAGGAGGPAWRVRDRGAEWGRVGGAGRCGGETGADRCGQVRASPWQNLARCHSARGPAWVPYKIVSLLGAGAMGEVYRARDLRLQRGGPQGPARRRGRQIPAAASDSTRPGLNPIHPDQRHRPVQGT